MDHDDLDALGREITELLAEVTEEKAIDWLLAAKDRINRLKGELAREAA